VKLAPEFAELPFDVNFAGVDVLALQADGLAPARSIHSPTVIFPALGSVHRPSRMRASW
jgi:hypothetical protein